MDRKEAIEIVREYYPSSGKELNEALETLIPELKEKEAMWMQDPITGEFMPVSYTADAPLGQDMKGNLIYPDDLKVALEVREADLEKEPASEDFESEWKRYCDFKGGGAVTMNIKDVARYFAQWQKDQMKKDAVEGYVSATIHLTKHCPTDIAEIQVKDSKTAAKVGEKVKVIIIKE